MKDIKRKLRKTVLEVLEKNKRARANDNELIYQVLKKLGMPTDYSELRDTYSNIAGSITRERNRAIKDNPLLQPAKHVVKRRMALEAKARKEYAGH